MSGGDDDSKDNDASDQESSAEDSVSDSESGSPPADPEEEPPADTDGGAPPSGAPPAAGGAPPAGTDGGAGGDVCPAFVADKEELKKRFKQLLTDISKEGTCGTKVNWTIDAAKIDLATSKLGDLDDDSIKNMAEILNKLTSKKIVKCLGQISSQDAINNGTETLLKLFTDNLAQLTGAIKRMAMTMIGNLGENNMNCVFLDKKLAANEPLTPLDAIKVFQN